MYKLFIDSIVVRIDYKKDTDRIYTFNNFINYLKTLDLYHLQYISIPAKFYNMHLTKNINGKPLLECFSFSDETKVNHQKIYIYSTYHGIYIAFHGLVQYDEDFRDKKLKLLHILYKSYTLKLTKIDIAIDLNEKIEDITIWDKSNKLLPYSVKSNGNAMFFQESTQNRSKQQRVLKLYKKDNQTHRTFPYGNTLSRIEMSLRATKLQTFSYEYLNYRINKEFKYYIIKLNDKVLNIKEDLIISLLDDLFKVLNHYKHNKTYACYYRNIESSLEKMKLAYLCYSNKTQKKRFVKHNDIGLTQLKKYTKYYEEKLTI